VLKITVITAALSPLPSALCTGEEMAKIDPL